jgi:hypothetical protein
MELYLSLGGLLGAIAGTVVAAVLYGPLVSRLEHKLRSRPRDAADRERFEQELTMMRYGLFAADILVCGGIGYGAGDWIIG